MANIIDDEWMKFMSRITRQMNCEAVDEDDDDTSVGNDPDIHIEPRTSVVAVMGGGGGSATEAAGVGAGGGGVGAGGGGVGNNHHDEPVTGGGSKQTVGGRQPKKSCISKKTQRRSYSFIDDHTSSGGVGVEDNPGRISVVASTSQIRKRFTPIYISTKTKIAYLNQPVNIYDIFWKIPVQHYYQRTECVIKKQIKFQTTDPAVVASIKEKLQQQPRCYDEFIIEHIDNPTGRIPYKDQRKVSIGLCKKDLSGGNHKKKRAFFNCFVVILRINAGIAPPDERAPEDDILYKEMHVKVFNTGKLEIPGVQEDATLIQVLQLLVSVLRPFLGDGLDYIRNRCETALINSNFNCGFYIDRDNLFHLLKYKYRMNCNYDSCSYPGIQSKFYYIPEKPSHDQNGQQPVSMSMPYYEVSFMIFRTGSILIVGKCNEDILTTIYRFICNILESEYSSIQMGDIIPVLMPPPTMTNVEDGGDGGDGGAGEAVAGAAGAAAPKKPVKNSRKKKLNTTDIRFYNDEAV
jgi:hypothetical protein